MTIEALLKITEDVEKLAEKHAKMISTTYIGGDFTKPTNRRIVLDPDKYESFKAGHASRDAEVDRLKRVILVMEKLITGLIISDRALQKLANLGDHAFEKAIVITSSEAQKSLAKAEEILKEGAR